MGEIVVGQRTGSGITQEASWSWWRRVPGSQGGRGSGMTALSVCENRRRQV